MSYKRAVLDCLIELFFDLEWPARIRLLKINEMDLVDLYYECCRVSNEASEFIIQEIIYYQLCEVAKGAPNNKALTSYPLMLTTTYPHTIIYPLCDIIEEIILSENLIEQSCNGKLSHESKQQVKQEYLECIDVHINYILFTLNEVINNDLIKRRAREMFSRIINFDDDLKIVKKFAYLF